MSLLSGVVVPEPSVIEALARGDGAAALALFSGPSKDPVKTKRTLGLVNHVGVYVFPSGSRFLFHRQKAPVFTCQNRDPGCSTGLVLEFGAVLWGTRQQYG